MSANRTARLLAEVGQCEAPVAQARKEAGGECLESCPLCAGTSFKQLYLTGDRHYGISGCYRVVRCSDCSLVFLNPMYSDDELAGLYPEDYYAYQERFQTNRWKERIKRLLGYRMGTKDPRFETRGTILDLGCGSGWFLETMRRRGWTTYGVEISEAAARLGRESKGLDIFGGTLREAGFPAEFFDYIRSNHSFEHISCPNDTLDEIRRVLKPGGKLLIGVPNVDSFTAAWFKEYWWYLTVPVHAFNYSVGTLTRLLAKHDFRVENVRFNSDYHGLVGSLQIWLNRKNGKKATEGMTVNNYLLRLTCQWAANLIDLCRRGDCIEITAVKTQPSHD